MEISPRNTWIRRPGCTAYTTFDFPTPPLGGFSFNQNGAFTLYVDTATNIYTVTPSSGTSIYTKGAGAGQASYLQLGSTLFIADGVDAIKIINGKVWNWGIVGPTTAPGVVVTASGAAAVNWTASTVYTTMGLLVDSNGNVEQLVSVNADGSPIRYSDHRYIRYRAASMEPNPGWYYYRIHWYTYHLDEQRANRRMGSQQAL